MGLSGGYSGPNVHDKVNSRARNLFVIAFAIIIYLLAGADLDQLTVLGLRAPSRYPIVFSWAAVLALFWFWWRYWIAWMDAESREVFNVNYREDLRQTDAFQKRLAKLKNVNDLADTLRTQFNGYSLSKGKDQIPDPVKLIRSQLDYSKRSAATVSSVTFQNTDHPHYEYIVEVAKLPGNASYSIEIPWWLNVQIGTLVFCRRAVRYEGFANQIMPQILALVALILIVCKVTGLDPAGFFEAIGNQSRPTRL